MTERFSKEQLAKWKERDDSRYTGICSGCGDERTDLFTVDDPVLCGDCGLRRMVLDMDGILLTVEEREK